jgi:hypothetical protein
MKKSFLNLAGMGLISCALFFLTAANAAEEKKPEKSAAEKAGDTKPEKKPRAIPFRGKVSAVDTKAGTLTVGERVFKVGAETKIARQGRTATLDEAVVGESVTGSYLKNEDGKLNAASIRLSPASEGGNPGDNKKKKPTPADEPKVQNSKPVPAKDK